MSLTTCAMLMYESCGFCVTMQLFCLIPKFLLAKAHLHTRFGITISD